jgi:tetratricopeptide (TPR) repeat protein
VSDSLDRLTAALADRYSIERELGSGGMATVYLAEDPKHHRKVAVKVLHPELAAALGPERFLQEIEIAAGLTHPHILPLHDSGEAGGFLYYVMPYIEGESLRDKLAHEGELPITEAVRILRDVVDALSHAHKHNVVHRDIKPDNVMLSDRHALVTDFGVAKAVSEATGRQKLTTEGVALGTPTYMAPEQAAAAAHIDHRADIYAVGAVAYELLTGRAPFTGTTQQEILAAHVTQAPEPVTKYRESVSPALEQLVLKCLEKKAADRWQSAEELLPQLEALATPSGGVTPTGMMPVSAVKRTWKVAAGAGTVAVVLAVILSITLFPRGSGVALDPNHVVVAVFRNETGDPSLNHLGSRTGHWITQGLQRAAIPVTPWDLAMQSWEYVQNEAEAGRVRNRVLALAEETGAGVVISGAIYPVEGDSLEVQVNLTDAERGRSLGTIDPLRGSLASTTEIISDVQQRVMVSLSVRFDRFSDMGDVVGEPPTFETYRAYTNGWEHQLRLEYAAALPFYRRAFELDSTWAQPLLRMRQALLNVGTSVQVDSVVRLLEGLWEELTPYEQAVTQSYRAAGDGDREGELAATRRAVELAPGSPAAYNISWQLMSLNRPSEAVDALRALDPERGWLREWASYWYSLTQALHMLGEHEQELEAAQRAFRLHPDRGASVLQMQTQALAALGRVEELNTILDEIEIADDLRWVRPALVQPVEILRAGGHREAAQRIAARAIEWFEARPPNEAADVGNREWYGRALFLAGRFNEAREIYDGLVHESPDNPNYRGYRAFIAAVRGDTVQALSDAVWFESLERPNLRMRTARWTARVAIAGALGEHEQVTELLREGRGRWMHTWFDRVDMRFDPLRDYAPFQEWMRPKG